MEKGIILARVSTDKQAKEGLSIEEIQLPSLYEYAKNNNIEVVKEFKVQESAAHKTRKKFDEVINYIKSNNDIDHLIVYRVDRITRNFRDSALIDRLRTEDKKTIHFVDDKLVINKESTGSAVNDWDYKVYSAKVFINNGQQHAKDTRMSRIKAGKILTKAPYGYKNNKNSDCKLNVIKEPFEEGIVKIIFDLYITKAHSYETIQEYIKTKYNLNFHKSKIEKILKNKFYKGIIELKDGTSYPHIYENIIDTEIWDMTEKIRNSRAISQGNRGKHKSKAGLYNGLIKCAECGCSIVAEDHINKSENGKIYKYTYYHCTNSKKLHNEKLKWVEEKFIDKQFNNLFKKLTIPKSELEKIKKLLKTTHEAKVIYYNEMHSKYAQEIAKYQNRIENCYIDKLDNRITQDEYDKLVTTFRTEKQNFSELLNGLNFADEEFYKASESILTVASNSEIIFENADKFEKREFIQLVLSNIELDSDKLVYKLEKPFDIIFKSTKGLQWGV